MSLYRDGYEPSELTRSSFARNGNNNSVQSPGQSKGSPLMLLELRMAWQQWWDGPELKPTSLTRRAGMSSSPRLMLLKTTSWRVSESRRRSVSNVHHGADERI